MYLKITSFGKDDFFSFLIRKNPKSGQYKKEFSDFRFVIGKYSKTPFDVIGVSYEIIVHNDEKELIKEYRKQNRSNYFSHAPFSVNHRNLKCASYALGSAMSSKWRSTDGFPETEAHRPRSLLATIGPFCENEDLVKEVYRGMGFIVQKLETKEKTQEAKAYNIFTSNQVPLYEFLQKIFVGAYFISYKQEDFVEESLWTSLEEMYKNWIHECKSKEIIDQILSKNKKKKQKSLQGSLHDERHKLILEKMSSIIDEKRKEPFRIVDLGCGGALLSKRISERFNNVSILGIDCDIRRSAFFDREKFKVIKSNIAYPNIKIKDCDPDVLILSEVIEHLPTANRQEVIRQVMRLWQPRHVFITVPNIEYNKFLDLKSKFRDEDHEIEYNKKELESEIINKMKNNYEISEIDMGYKVNPSFILFMKRIEDFNEKKSEEEISTLISKKSAIITSSGVEIKSKEIEDGFCKKQFMKNLSNIFYLSPTMSPVGYVDHSGRFDVDFLEHPAGAFEYYKSMGVKYIVEQEKYMGSRVNMIIFKDKENAERAGFKNRVYILSKSGFSFLEEEEISLIEDKICESINWKELDDYNCNFVAFDCEALPWSFKSEEISKNDFIFPAECSLVYNELAGIEKTSEENDSLRKYIEVFKRFASPCNSLKDLHFKVFSMLAIGKFDEFYSIGSFPFIEEDVDMMMLRINKLIKENNIISPSGYFVLDTDSLGDYLESQMRWSYKTKLSDSMSEGFVYKPLSPLCCWRPDKQVQPALKVRGREYLRLVYGPNYTKNIKEIKNRDIQLKRKIAHREHLISVDIIKLYFSHMRITHEVLVSGFLGMKSSNGRVDRTL